MVVGHLVVASRDWNRTCQHAGVPANCYAEGGVPPEREEDHLRHAVAWERKALLPLEARPVHWEVLMHVKPDPERASHWAQPEDLHAWRGHPPT